MSRSDLNERLKDVFDDADAIAAQYREQGWDAIAVHPGDVNPVTEEATLYVLLPDPEFNKSTELLSDRNIDQIRVYAAPDGKISYQLVAAEDTDEEFALCVPTYVLPSDMNSFKSKVMEAGSLGVRLRPLDDRDYLEFALEEPELFFQSNGE